MSPFCHCQIFCCVSAGTIAINPSGSTYSYFQDTQDPISADAGSRRIYVSDVPSGM
jgi:hypothetical protein